MPGAVEVGCPAPRTIDALGGTIDAVSGSTLGSIRNNLVATKEEFIFSVEPRQTEPRSDPRREGVTTTEDWSKQIIAKVGSEQRTQTPWDCGTEMA